MLWLARFTSLTITRTRAALALTLIAAAACADRVATAPEHAATQRASAAINPLPPSFAPLPANLTFGLQAVGTSSAPQVVTLRNNSPATIVMGVIAVNGPYFTQTNNCQGTLGPDRYCAISVVYTPAWSGPDSATLSISSNVPGSPNVVSLNGTGFVPTAAISITPTAIGFGGVTLGTATSGRVVKITSTGTAPLVVSLALGGVNPGDFAIWADGCTGVSLNPGASCTAYVSFEPLRIGARSATVTIAHNASGGSAAVSLSGTGVKGSGGYIP